MWHHGVSQKRERSSLSERKKSISCISGFFKVLKQSDQVRFHAMMQEVESEEGRQKS